MARDSFAAASARFQSKMVKALTGYYRLQDFIHAVRGCRTIAEERKLVIRESASIRTSFKKDISASQRYHAVAKLLFIYMMGYPAHFGQVESLKMVASPRILQKRLGYLGSTQLIDEEQPTLTLITNSIKNDLNNSNQTVVALGLANLASTASVDIARDLSDEVERLIRASSPYIRKKAAFCASRLVNSVNELSPLFEPFVKTLLSDRNHAVILGGLALADAIIKCNASFLGANRMQLIAILLRHLQSIISGGYNGEYDVGGVNDPFVQVKILRMIRTCATNHQEASESVADLLTQIATCTDSSRNVGHAVLYETAVTIMNIESDEALRTMAINILGRLLSSPNSDHNLRFVALSILAKAMNSDTSSASGMEAVQRHRSIVLECLEDADVSIKRRAMDLALGLVNQDTITAIMPELLQAAISMQSVPAMEDYCSSMFYRLCLIAAKFAPSGKWYVDTILFLLARLAPQIDGSVDRILSHFLAVVRNTSSLPTLACEQLFHAAVITDEQGSLVFGEGKNKLLVSAAISIMGDVASSVLIGRGLVANDSMLLSLMMSACRPRQERTGLRGGRAILVVDHGLLALVITSIGKLVYQFDSLRSAAIPALQEIAEQHALNDVIGRRSREMCAIIGNQSLLRVCFGSEMSKGRTDSAVGIADSLHHICDSDGVLPRSMRLSSSSNNPSMSSSMDNARTIPDVFTELANLSLDEETAKQLGKLVFEQYGLRVHAKLVSDGNVRLSVCNVGSGVVRDVLLQAAVPRSLRVNLEVASGTELDPGSSIQQSLTVTDVQGAVVSSDRIKLRIKFAFCVSGGSLETFIFDVSHLE